MNDTTRELMTGVYNTNYELDCIKKRLAELQAERRAKESKLIKHLAERGEYALLNVNWSRLSRVIEQEHRDRNSKIRAVD